MNSKDYYKNGQIIKILENDVLTYYFIDGTIKAQGSYINDMMEGKWVFYKKEGSLWQIAHFLHNQKHGEWTRYYSDGSMEYHEFFDHGKIQKQKNNI